MLQPRTVLIVAAAVALTACAGKKSQPDSPSADSTPPATSAPAPADTGIGPPAQAESAPVGQGPSGGLLERRVVYFDFDKSEVRAEDLETVNAHARWLAANPQRKVRLEGHTDARGTREYNIGLGERRGQAVRRLLLLQGVTDGQVLNVSFGEERPAAEGDEEAAFAQNRRVEFVYTP